MPAVAADRRRSGRSRPWHWRPSRRPYVLPTSLVNILVRAFLYAVVALTVDILWGYTGILTFGQSAFFGIGAYAAGLTFTHLGFNAGYRGVGVLRRYAWWQ